VNEPGDRDALVDRWLRRGHTVPPDADVTAACLDGETIAAWVDGGLSGHALQQAQDHAAGCARCQTLLGAFARAEGLAQQAKPERPSRPWLTWLVPLTAAAAVVLTLVISRVRDERAQSAGANAVGQQVADAVRNDEKAKPADAPHGAPASLAPPQRRAAPSGSLATRGATSAAQATREEAMSRPAPIGPPAAAADAAKEVATSQLQRQANAAVASAFEIRSPDPASRWRVSGSSVERSTDGGSSWEAVPTGVTAHLTAGASPSPSVCWLVGRAGVVLVSADGRTWRRLPFPEVTDLLAVRAVDALTATVTTAAGRAFSTTDGGLTWTGHLQEF
jgi:hypothetical protein